MKIRLLLTSIQPHFSRSCCLFALPVLMVLHSCKDKDTPDVSTPLSTTYHSTKSDEKLTFLIIDRVTQEPLSNVMVEINTRGGFIRHDYTNDSGRVQFKISKADSGWMEMRCEKTEYSLFWNKLQIDGSSKMFTITMDRFAYLRWHLINQVPISTSERIDLFINQKEYNYWGATDITFIEQLDVYTQSISCKRYWNNVQDSSYSIPLHLISGDTTDITITF